jgi:hypothetical protein
MNISPAFLKMQDEALIKARLDGGIETPKKDEKWTFKANPKAMMVLFIVLLIKITNQWHRKALTYAFGFAMPEGFPMD